jgi:hypothetical protein
VVATVARPPRAATLELPYRRKGGSRLPVARAAWHTVIRTRDRSSGCGHVDCATAFARGRGKPPKP